MGGLFASLSYIMSAMRVDNGALRDFLIGNGLVTRSQLADALSSGGGEALYDALAARGILSEDDLRRAAAHVAGVAFVVLTPHEIAFETLSLIPEPVARARNIVAYRQEGGAVEVAMLDLADLEAVEFLRAEHGLTVLPRLTTAGSLRQTLRTYQQYLKEQFKALVSAGGHAVDALIRHALLSRATGVHLDLRETGLLVRYRIQGMLHEAMQLPKEASHLFERFKSLANLSLTLHVPQEGRFKAQLAGGDAVGVRVATAPGASAERMTLHLTPERSRRQGFTLESLGLHGAALEETYRMLQKHGGLIVVAGEEGSGRTTALYTLLDLLGERGSAIVTVEEEIEHALPHAVQIKVRPELGLTWTGALRAALRQDPDIIMIGDISDSEAALMASEAAARGILVLAGIDSASTADALKRLERLGVSGLVLGAVLRGAIGVRVVRKLCKKNKDEYRLSRAESEPLELAKEDGRMGANLGRVLAALKEEEVVEKDAQWKELTFARAAGCAECVEGYWGQTGLQEVLPATLPIKELLKEGASIEELEAQARKEGMLTLAEDGLFKAAQGATSVEEVLRVARE